MKTCYLLFLTIISICSPVFAEEAVSYNKELDGFDYPFDVETFSFKSQNQSLNMRYMDIGNKSSRKLLSYYTGKISRDITGIELHKIY